LLASVGGDADLVALQKNPTTTSDGIEATRLRVRSFVSAGEREIGAAFLDETPPLLKTNRLQRFLRDFNPYDAEGAPHVEAVTITGPFNPVSSEKRSPFPEICRPATPRGEPLCARRIISTIARRAFRRPLAA